VRQRPKLREQFGRGNALSHLDCRAAVAAGREIGQGNIDAHVIAGALHGSLHGPPDRQLIAEHLEIDLLILVSKGSTAPDHERARHSAEICG